MADQTDYETAFRTETGPHSSDSPQAVFVREDGSYTPHFPDENIVRRVNGANETKYVVYAFVGTHDAYEERAWAIEDEQLAVQRATKVYGKTPDSNGGTVEQMLADAFDDHGGEVFEVEVHEVPADEFAYSSTAHNDLRAGIDARLDVDEWDGPAVEVTLGEGVTVLWDTWADPVVTVWPDSPYYQPNPGTHSLYDYHDGIAEAVEEAFPADRTPTEWELSFGEEISGDSAHDFYAFGVMREQH